MATYTIPTTRVTGNLITASIWNTDVVENIKYFKDAPAFAGNVTVAGTFAVTGAASADVMDFDQTPTAAGAVARLRWNSTDGTLDLGMIGGNVTQQIGQESYVYARNSSGVTVTDGAACYVVGSTGTRTTIAMAKADSASTSAATIGIATEEITNNNDGLITTFGLVRNLNTSALTEGAAVYVSAATAGALTSTKPADPNFKAQVGFCIRSHGSLGSVLINTLVSPSLEDLNDVTITAVANNDVVKYQTSSGTWINTTSLTLSDLTLSTALAAASGGTGLTSVGTSGNLLTSNGSAWVSSAPAAGASTGSISASVASNILTLSLTTTDGSTPSAGSPVTLTFRHVTPATGSLSTVSVTAATTVDIPNTATLGTSNSVAFRVWVVAFNDGGTVRLGAINCANSTSIYPLAGLGIASSTAVSTGSDSAQVFYTGTSVSAKAYTVLGYVSYDAGLATAGTWSSAPTQAQPLRPDTRLPGSTVQVVYATYATEVSSSSATYADTGLTATITPTSTPNRMLISAVQTGLRKNNNTYGRVRLLRGATMLADLELQYGFTNTTAENTVGATAINYVDLPASVAATTYKTTFASATGAATVSLQMSGSMSTIVVQEIMI